MTQSKDGNGHQEEYDPEVELDTWILMSGLRQMMKGIKTLLIRKMCWKL